MGSTPDQGLSPRRVVVIGAGAAGTMAAIFAASAGAETLLLEGTEDGGRKILISGGGRCNVLPMTLDESRYVTDSSPNTLKRILRSWPLPEQRRFFQEEVGVPLAEEPADRKLFPASNRARDVRDGLLALAEKRGARVWMNTRVSAVRPPEPATAPSATEAPLNTEAPSATEARSAPGRWEIRVPKGPPLTADALVLATGGLSVPSTGSDGFGFRTAREMGHTVHPTYAALTPILAAPSPFTALSGVSLTVTLTARSEARQATATGGFLFTHRGYSGPAVLDVSHVLVRARTEGGEPARLQVQWTPLGEKEWDGALKAGGPRTVQSLLRNEMPDRLATLLLDRAGVDPHRTLAELRREERLGLLDVLVRSPLPWTGDEGYKKAEVTGGGVSLGEVDPRTLESRKHPGLFLCGEILDAFGPIGGYNFYWAWATGRAAGMGAGAGA